MASWKHSYKLGKTDNRRRSPLNHNTKVLLVVHSSDAATRYTYLYVYIGVYIYGTCIYRCIYTVCVCIYGMCIYIRYVCAYTVFMYHTHFIKEIMTSTLHAVQRQILCAIPPSALTVAVSCYYYRQSWI